MLTDVDACTETYSESSAKNNLSIVDFQLISFCQDIRPHFGILCPPRNVVFGTAPGELLGVFSNLPVVHEPADPCVWTEGRASSLARAVFSTIVCVV